VPEVRHTAMRVSDVSELTAAQCSLHRPDMVVCQVVCFTAEGVCDGLRCRRSASQVIHVPFLANAIEANPTYLLALSAVCRL